MSNTANMVFNSCYKNVVIARSFCLMVALLLAALPVSARIHRPLDIACVTTLSATVAADTCGQRTGSISLTHNGTAPFTYTWTHDTTLAAAIATGLASGSYAVTVRDSVGCQIDTTIFIAAFSPMQLTGFSTPDTCGAPNGTATVQVQNPNSLTPPFVFQWDTTANSQTTSVATGLVRGLYRVFATDAAGCAASIELNVGTTQNNFSTQVSGQDARCFGDSSGSATVIATGGNGVFSYTWTALGDTLPLGNNPTIAGLQAGGYQIVVQDLAGPACQSTRAVIIAQPDSVRADFATLPASDCRDADGTAIAQPSGGSAPYTYLWSTGGTDDTLFNVAPGFYTLTVTDSNNCSDTRTVVMTSSSGPDLDVEILQEDNCGLGEAIVRVNIRSGRAPFAITWWVNRSQPSDTSTNPTYAYNLFRTTGVPASVIVVDADSCVNLVNFDIPGNEPLIVSGVVAVNNYCELANGETTVAIGGGTPPYRYQWTTSPVQTDQTAVGLIAGSYSVLVRDSFNCTISATAQVADEPGFTLDVQTTDVTCYGQNDGTATALVAGARGALAFAWTTQPPSAEPAVRNLRAGVYNVTVTDGEGCTRTDFGTVASVQYVEADFTSSPDTNQVLPLGTSTVSFVNRSQGGDSYRWEFGDGATSTEYNPTHIYTDTGTYYVRLIVQDADQVCADTLVRGPYFISLDGTLFIPNAFSPNTDGFNDSFDIRADQIETYQIDIFGRWGQRVFSSASVSDSWRGFLPNGKAAPTGVYMYVVRYTLPGGQPRVQSGSVTLFR
ncbi:MAG: hypothetical protein OHK0039_45220 [Bacteroidia bacterium]